MFTESFKGIANSGIVATSPWHVPDAHELGAIDNTEAERRKDKINNAVGRQYALQHRSREDILGLLMTDPKVIWN